ncbi:MAG: hypothetical protein P8X89_04875 [Reinekea sp.]
MACALRHYGVTDSGYTPSPLSTKTERSQQTRTIKDHKTNQKTAYLTEIVPKYKDRTIPV